MSGWLCSMFRTFVFWDERPLGFSLAKCILFWLPFCQLDPQICDIKHLSQLTKIARLRLHPDKHTLKRLSEHSTHRPAGLALCLMCLCMSINLSAALVNHSLTLSRMADSSLGNTSYNTCQEFVLLFAKKMKEVIPTIDTDVQAQSIVCIVDPYSIDQVRGCFLQVNS